MVTRPCPGRCGRDIPRDALLGCRPCTRTLPRALRARLWTTWHTQDWPRHSRALSDALLWLATRPGPPSTWEERCG